MTRRRSWAGVASALAIASLGATTDRAAAGPTGEGPASVALDHYARVVLADRPAAYWRFDETHGTTAADLSGHSRDARYVGHPVLGAPGLVRDHRDPAVRMTRPGQGVTWASGEQSYRGNFSVELWLSPGSSRAHRTLIGSVRGGTTLFRLVWNGAPQRGLGVSVGNGARWYVHENFRLRLRPRATYDVVLVAKRREVQLYLDGMPLTPLTYRSCGQGCAPPVLFDRHSVVGVGTTDSADLPSRSFVGRLDEVAWFEHALTGRQVYDLWYVGRGAPTGQVRPSSH
jgi:hypothetical protein